MYYITSGSSIRMDSDWLVDLRLRSHWFTVSGVGLLKIIGKEFPDLLEDDI